MKVEDKLRCPVANSGYPLPSVPEQAKTSLATNASCTRVVGALCGEIQSPSTNNTQEKKRCSVKKQLPEPGLTDCQISLNMFDRIKVSTHLDQPTSPPSPFVPSRWLTIGIFHDILVSIASEKPPGSFAAQATAKVEGSSVQTVHHTSRSSGPRRDGSCHSTRQKKIKIRYANSARGTVQSSDFPNASLFAEG